MTAAVEVNSQELSEFCRRNSIRRLSLFGSVLTERFSESSDVDVLVEFQPDARVGYLRMAAMERELSRVFGGRKVDLRTLGELSPYFRDEVLRMAVVQYVASRNIRRSSSAKYLAPEPHASNILLS